MFMSEHVHVFNIRQDWYFDSFCIYISILTFFPSQLTPANNMTCH